MDDKPITTNGFCPIQKKKYNIDITYEKEPDSDIYTAKSYYCDNLANCHLDECPIKIENKHYLISKAKFLR